MTKYTLQTEDEEEAMQAIMARRVLCFIGQWENVMREARKYESGALYGLNLEEIEDVWYQIKESYGVET